MSPGPPHDSKPIAPELTLPPERFCWAVVDGAGLSSTWGKHLHQQLGYLFENALPVPLEDVQAAYLRLPAVNGTRSYLACGMARDDLQKCLSANNALTRLCPSHLPPFIVQQLGKDSTVDPMALNLLHGEYEPRQLKTLRRRWLVQIAAMLGICAMVVMFGMQRRTAWAKQRIAQIEDAKAEIHTHVIGSPASGSSTTQPPAMRMLAELRRLRQTRQNPIEELADVDAVPSLVSLLQRWPDDVHMQTESLLVNSSTITVRGAAPASADVQRLADALQGIKGWRMQQPQINANRDAVQVTLQFKPAQEPSR